MNLRSKLNRLLAFIEGLPLDAFEDEPREREGAVKLEKWPYLVWPLAKEYRIVEYPLETFHKYQMQAKVDNEWVDLLSYDDGYDVYGRLERGQWRKTGEMASWSIRGLIALRNVLLGITPPLLVISDASQNEDIEDDNASERLADIICGR